VIEKSYKCSRADIDLQKEWITCFEWKEYKSRLVKNAFVERESKKQLTRARIRDIEAVWKEKGA
jgi:hypothetical protein